MPSSAIPFTGKYFDRPGPLKGVDWVFENVTNRDIDDLEIYVFPTSGLVDTPDMARVRLEHNGQVILQKDNADSDGDAIGDLDEIKILHIEPPIRPGDTLRVVIDFEAPFAEDEGIAILGTVGGRGIGSTDSGQAATGIPVGPTAWDVIIELLKLAAGGASSAAKPLLGPLSSADGTGSGATATLAEVALASRRLSAEGLLALSTLFRDDPVLHRRFIDEACARRRPKSGRAGALEIDFARRKRDTES